jgi:hypothetical protein
MGGAASAPSPFPSEEAALAAGKTQADIDAWKEEAGNAATATQDVERKDANNETEGKGGEGSLFEPRFELHFGRDEVVEHPELASAKNSRERTVRFHYSFTQDAVAGGTFSITSAYKSTRDWQVRGQSVWPADTAVDPLSSPAQMWESFKGQDVFPGTTNRYDEMAANDLAVCRCRCVERGYGAFVVLHGRATFRRQTSTQCRAQLSREKLRAAAASTATGPGSHLESKSESESGVSLQASLSTTYVRPDVEEVVTMTCVVDEVVLDVNANGLPPGGEKECGGKELREYVTVFCSLSQHLSPSIRHTSSSHAFPHLFPSHPPSLCTFQSLSLSPPPSPFTFHPPIHLSPYRPQLCTIRE